MPYFLTGCINSWRQCKHSTLLWLSVALIYICFINSWFVVMSFGFVCTVCSCIVCCFPRVNVSGKLSVHLSCQGIFLFGMVCWLFQYVLVVSESIAVICIDATASWLIDWSQTHTSIIGGWYGMEEVEVATGLFQSLKWWVNYIFGGN